MGKDLLVGELRLDEGEHLFGGRGVAADAAVELDRDVAFEGEADVVAELPGAHLDDGEGADAAGEVTDQASRERVEGDRPEQAGLDPAGAGLFDDRLQDASDDSVADEDEVGVLR